MEKRCFRSVSQLLALILVLTVLSQSTAWAWSPAAPSPSMQTITGQGVEVTYPTPANPNDLTTAIAKEMVTISEHAVCLNQADEYRQQLSSAPQTSTAILAAARVWYASHKDDECVATAASDVATSRVIMDADWYKDQPAEEKWHVLTRQQLIDSSKPETAGVYRGLLEVTSPAEFRKRLNALLANPAVRDHLIADYVLKVKDNRLNACQVQEFVAKLERNEYKAARMAAAYWANHGRNDVRGENFVYEVQPGEPPLLAARVLVDGCADRHLSTLTSCRFA